MYPGNGVASVYSSPTATSSARPSQDSIPVRTERSHGAPERSRNATRAPAPSSHALVGRAKKVHGWEMAMPTTHSTNEIAVRTETTISSRRSLRRHSQKPSARIAGQNR